MLRTSFTLGTSNARRKSSKHVEDAYDEVWLAYLDGPPEERWKPARLHFCLFIVRRSVCAWSATPKLDGTILR